MRRFGIAHASMALRSLNHILDHYIFLLSLALGNHKGERHESIIGKAFGADKPAAKTVNDSTWRETVKEHFIRDVEGSSVELKYRFLDPNKELMAVEFENGKAKVVAREFWVRISDRKIRKK